MPLLNSLSNNLRYPKTIGNRYRRYIGIIACICIILASGLFISNQSSIAIFCLIVGTVGVVVVSFFQPMPDEAVPTAENQPFRWTLLLGGSVCLALLLASNLAAPPTISNHIQFVLFCAGIILVTAGFAKNFPPMEKNTLRLVGTITLIAFVLRVIGLDGIIRFFVDEIHFSHSARTLLTHNRPLIARFDEVIAFPWLYSYLESLTIGLFGRNLVGLRLISAIMGTLTIPAVYLLARALFNKPVALAAALLLATFPPHIHLSRLSLNNIADPLFGTLALGWLAWGWKTGHRGYFALAGAALGLTQYFYDGGRLLYPPLICTWLVGSTIFLWLRRGEGQGRAIGTLITLFVAVLIALPLYAMIALNGQDFSARFTYEGNSLDGFVLDNIWRRTGDVFRLYVEYPETTYFYKGTTPLLLVFVSAPFLIGLAYAAARMVHFKRDGLLLLLWVLATSVGNALLIIPLSAARYAVVFPAFMLAAALGLYFGLQVLRRREREVRYLLMWVAIAIAIGQTTYYFFVHVPLYNDESRIYEDSQDAAFRSADFPPYTQVHLVAEPYRYHMYALNVMEFLRDDVFMFALSSSEFNSSYLEGLPRDVDNAFYLLPYDTASLELLHQYFVVSEPQYSPYPLPPNREFLLYYASHEDNPPLP